MIKGISLTDIFIDCNNPEKLIEFYHNLTAWKKFMKYGKPCLLTKDGLAVHFRECDVIYNSPVWPEEVGKQQKQIHLDFAVEDLDSAVSEAIKLGAKKSPNQFGGDKWVTLFDPEGHPFCLGVDE